MKSKIYVIVSAIILFVAIVSSTLALVYFRSNITDVNLTFDTDLGRFINYNNGTPILGEDGKILDIVDDYTGGLSTEIELWKTDEARNMDIYGHIYLNLDSGTEELFNMEALKWSVTSNDILISEGNFIGYSEGSSIPILINHELLTTLTKFKVYVWLDKNGYVNSNAEGKTLIVTVRCQATSGEYKIVNDLGQEYIYDYTGNVETVNLSSGIYMLEVWGAQGGYGMNETYRGGYGGYSLGYINLDTATDVFIAVGGQGGNGLEKVSTLNAGGFNGGGNSYGTTNIYVGSGGGATHIALSDGLLSSLSENTGDILIVAGGGGGGGYLSSTYSGTGGDAGGYIGNDGTTIYAAHQVGSGGTQLAGGTGYGISGSFGQGGNATNNAIGGGGGFYGGGVGRQTSGSGGGSGYIGNPLLTDKVMYCYKCNDSSEKITKTISTTFVSEEAISNYSKRGNGYARITKLLSTPVKFISRKEIVYGTDYDFKTMASDEIEDTLTIIDSTFDNANTLSVGEYQVRYDIVDTDNNRYVYYQKIEIVE